MNLFAATGPINPLPRVLLRIAVGTHAATGTFCLGQRSQNRFPPALVSFGIDPSISFY